MSSGQSRDAGESSEGTPALSMAEVLSSPSPRRAAREAAAREAALREAAEREAAPPVSAAQVPVPASNEVVGQPTVAMSIDDLQGEGGREPAAMKDAALPAPRPAVVDREVPVDQARSEHAGLTLDVDALFGGAARDAGSEAHEPDGEPDDGEPVRDDVPASEWAESLRRASIDAEAAAAARASSIPAEEPRARSRSSMTTAQKILFVALALVIVAGVVALILLLTSPGAGAASASTAQSMSTSYGSVSTSSITPLSISSGRNG